MESIEALLKSFSGSDIRALARCITVVENELPGSEMLLASLQPFPVPVIGFTGPPGAGKSTLINGLITRLTNKGKRIAVIAVDPTSPFHHGSLLGDRLRMAEHFTNDKVFIRSLATRGSLGGVSAKSIEVMDVLRSFPEKPGKPWFDYVFIETVGVGQSEVEVAGLADTTVLVLVPGYGDEVQALKSGIMEIGDVYAVNKCDQPGADGLVKTLEQLVHGRAIVPPVLKVSATEGAGMDDLSDVLQKTSASPGNEKKLFLLTEKAYQLIRQRRMKDIRKNELEEKLKGESGKPGFNLYRFVSDHS